MTAEPKQKFRRGLWIAPLICSGKLPVPVLVRLMNGKGDLKPPLSPQLLRGRQCAALEEPSVCCSGMCLPLAVPAVPDSPLQRGADPLSASQKCLL